MDEGLSRAVLKVFVELYRAGLIYKDKRLVNWDPKLLTAISDLEVQQVEVKGQLWHFKYPIEGLADTFITVATTRPETMLGDTAVAVHPDDERYRHLIGKQRDPAAGRPAHSDRRRRIFRSREGHRRGQDHAGARLQRFRGRPPPQPAAGQRARRRGEARSDGQRGVPRDVPPSAELDETLDLHGLDRFAARKKIVERLEAAGLLDKIEPHTHMVPHGDRSRRRDRAVPDRPVVRRRQDAGRSRRSRRCAPAAPCSCRRTGRRPISTGWRTSSPGASRASSGGATRSRPGTAPTTR